MKRSELNEIAKAIALEEGTKLSEEIKTLGKDESVLASIGASIPIIAARTTVKIITELGLIQIDPEDAD